MRRMYTQLLILIIMLAMLWTSSPAIFTSVSAEHPFGLAAHASSPLRFQKIYKKPVRFNKVIGPLEDKGFLLAGTSLITPDDELFAARIDRQGTFSWAKMIGNRSGGASWLDRLSGAIKTDDEGLVTIGVSSTRVGSSPLFYLIAARLDNQGNVAWVRLYSNSGVSGENRGRIAWASNGDLVIALVAWDGMLGQGWLRVARLDGDGRVRWSRSYSVPSELKLQPIFDEAIVAVPEGGFLVVGTMRNEEGGVYDRDIFAVRLDDRGNVQWSKRYFNQPDISNEARAVVPAPDGGFLIVGVTSTYYFANQRAYLLRIDSQGRVQWARTYATTRWDDPDSYDHTEFRDVLRLDEGGFAMAGSTGFPSDLYALRINDSREVLWHRSYGGRLFDPGYAVARTADGGFLFMGTTNSFGDNEVYMVKTDSAGISGVCHERIPRLVIRTPDYQVEDISWSEEPWSLNLVPEQDTVYEVLDVSLQETPPPCVYLPFISR
ncbi:MAG: hypothetical protein RML36_11085 [Anaerolineae bacterium]|nr:hypothetical protein [Anaerolineae bacterium]MDW8100011.1 hypothetical protein [Anaerolineae bacterium]